MKRNYRSGEANMIVALVGFFIVMVLVALSIKILPMFTYKDNLDTLATKVIRTAEVQGTIDVAYDAYVATLNLEDVTVDIVANNTGGRVQLDEDITVTVNGTYKIEFWGAEYAIELHSVKIGKSEKYYKDL